MSDNLIKYPARSSEFLALLEQHEGLADWEMHGRPNDEKSYVTFSPRSSAAGPSTRSRECLVYFDKRAPIVQLGKVSFDLLRLFEKGQPWDPQVYTSNPYMPDTAKRFLNQLFAVLITKPAIAEAACASSLSKN
jgi:hypothetical protein